jgi:drug/metabolite transporter (DMT)-like permease
MSLESVFAVIGGMVLLHEGMELKELLGCGLMFAAVVLSQIPVGAKRAKV